MNPVSAQDFTELIGISVPSESIAEDAINNLMAAINLLVNPTRGVWLVEMGVVPSAGRFVAWGLYYFTPATQIAFKFSNP